MFFLRYRTIAIAFLLLAIVSLAACESVGYYGQAISGQIAILGKRQDIEKLIANDATAPDLRLKLETILEIREFAENRLALPLANSYSTYVDLERPYVVWNVFAVPEFSMRPYTWCYPIAGCSSYRGYFSEEKARSFAEKLKQDGLDVYVGGVSAYSTLGWFSDPVLSTIVSREDHQLASLLFHELAHQVVYVPGDTRFNESFATALEQEGLKRWLNFARDEESSAAIIAAANLESLRRAQFVSLVSETVSRLELLYSSNMDVELMRDEKQAAINDLRADYAILREESWNGYRGYDRWFSRDLNNAQLNTVATYNTWVPAFTIMLERVGGDLQRFYAAVEELATRSRAERDSYLSSLLPHS